MLAYGHHSTARRVPGDIVFESVAEVKYPILYKRGFRPLGCQVYRGWVVTVYLDYYLIWYTTVGAAITLCFSGFGSV